MFDKIISFSIEKKSVVIAAVVVLIVAGVYSAAKLPIDAMPDITSNQVQVLTNAPTLAPLEVERLISYPVELAMRSLPGIEEVRSTSKFGVSIVTVVFKDNVETYFARQLVFERLTEAKANIPAGLGEPQIGPVSTGLGEIYRYIVEGKGRSAMELKTVQEWIIRPQLLGVEGVADINAFGGETRQVQISLQPQSLLKYGITLADVFKAVEANNNNAGGAYIEHGGEQFLIRSVGFAENAADIEGIIVAEHEGTPVKIKDLATVEDASAVRQGATTVNGTGEAVSGVVLMLKGQNSREVAARVIERLEEIKKTLPEGVKVVPFYDRTVLVERTIKTVLVNLAEGCLLVIAVVLLLLVNIRAGLIVASVIPLSMLFALTLMYLTGQSGNLMSLGAIDFGLIVDGTIIIVEACLRVIAERNHELGRALTKDELRLTVRGAAIDVRRAAQFGELIILVVYLPIFTLQGIEGKMFKPMAWTVGFAIIGAVLLALTYVPMMCSIFLQKRISEKDSFLMAWAKRGYTPVLAAVLRYPKTVMSSAAAAFVVSLFLFLRLAGEFSPNLDEGEILIQSRKLPSVSLTESVRISGLLEKALLEFPEVLKVVTNIGRPDVATDPMSIYQGDVYINLKDPSEWTTATTKEGLVEKMSEKLAGVPAVAGSFSQPIEMRFNELIAGVRSDVGVKIFGDDLEKLSELGNEIAKVMLTIDGARDVRAPQIDGLSQIQVSPNREKLSRFGLSIADVNEAIEIAFAGKVAGQIYDGERRFDLTVRYDKSNRQSIEDVRATPIPLRLQASSGGMGGNVSQRASSQTGSTVSQIRLDAVAEIEARESPAEIGHEKGRRLLIVEANVRERDIESFVRELQTKLNAGVKLPVGYRIEYGGEFQKLESARSRLVFVVPIALLLIFGLLYQTFGRARDAAMVFAGIPFATIGGIFALWISGQPFSISAGVGFIALFGVAVLNGIMMVSAMNQFRSGRVLVDAIMTGSEQRLRPVLTTALVASLGFIPMALSHGAGAEVQRPLATVVIGGLITSTVLTLFVLPTLYEWIERRKA